MHDLKNDLALAEKAAREAGRMALEIQKKGFDIQHKPEAGGSPVTEADFAADNHLHKTLLAACPDYGWLSEETEDDPSQLEKDRVWVVDPIDGTKAFIKGEPDWAVSVGLIENGQPVVGVIFNPATGEMFSGLSTGPVYCDGVEVHCNWPDAFENHTLFTSQSETRMGLWDFWQERMPMVTSRSIAYKLALVACGEKAQMLGSLKPKSLWDVAAGHALCLAAGMHMSQLGGVPVNYRKVDELNGIVAAPSRWFSQLCEALPEQVLSREQNDL